ncbi:MAG: SDR family oxidoreductase [Caulobacteraceae bacterium]|nr:SDR family oxidoreductase [Caulobacteraceae bacterium]
MTKKILVLGRGPIGWNTMEHFLSHRPDWAVAGASRKAPPVATRAHYVTVDLTDRAATMTALGTMGDVTHVLYTAVLDQPTFSAAWTEATHIETNLGMLKNVLDALEAAKAPLENFAFLQGTKAYGVHLGPIKAPARERDPMHMPPSFYHAQQDYVFERQRGRAWSWTIYRPQIVVGLCPGAPTNHISAIGAYCAISRELGLPLRFPGPLRAGLVELVDARLLASAIAWGMSNAQASANQIFNVTNGDVLDWQNLFPRLARHFGMELERPQTMSLATMMADKGPVWDRIVAKHDLQRLSYGDISGNWMGLDYTVHYMALQQPPPILSTIKIRQAGFHECRDTEDMFLAYIEEMQEARYLPR